MKKANMGYWKSVKRRIVLVPLALVGVLALAPGVASAWLSWDGIDPIIKSANGHELSVKIEWPKEFTCGVDSNIKVRVKLPAAFDDSEVVSESQDGFPCADGTHTIATTTRILGGGHGDDGEVRVDVKGQGRFPVTVTVTVDGDVTVQEGVSNRQVKVELE